MDFIYQVCKSQMVINPKDVIIQTAGVLGIGERIFVTAKLPTYEIAKDEMENIFFSLQVMMEVVVFRLVSLIFVLYVTIR